MKTFRIVLLSSFVAVTATFLLAFGVSVHTVTAHASAIPNASAPIVNIVQNGSTDAFSPTKVHLYFRHSQYVEFDNMTNVVQILLNRNEKLFAKLAPSMEELLVLTNQPLTKATAPSTLKPTKNR